VTAAKPTLLIAESVGFPRAAAEQLAQHVQVIEADLDRAGLLQAVRTADLLWVRLRYQIDEEVLDAAPHLRLIATPTTGLTHIDLNAAARRGVRVLSLQGETEFLRDIRATAEHTLALILALLRKVAPAVASVQNGHWQRDLFRGCELYQKTAGVIGYGRLGRIVARYLLALGMQVLTCDPVVQRGAVEPDVELVSQAELLARAQLITLHANLTETNVQFFGATAFAAMQPGAWFINTARGELVDEAALLHALTTGQLAGAAIDVLARENTAQLANHPLIAYAKAHDNLLITPHLGGCTFESREKTELFLAKRLSQEIA
jgi:D-3-phosphoglycerate dehydrogenase / 2-oxoglutarate reductase